MSTEALHFALLRPAIIHILRAAGFHSARPSVLDTLTDLCARYLLLIASRTADSVYDRTYADDETSNHVQRLPPTSQIPSLSSLPGPFEIPEHLDLPAPTVSDVRLALASVAFFTSTQTASEEVWDENLRKPLSSYPLGARDKERRRRDIEDTRDVQEFIDWASGPVAQEERRIAGLLKEEGDQPALPNPSESTGTDALAAATVVHPEKDDYLANLKKKHSKTGDGARYSGTVLGRQSDETVSVRIEGGHATLEAWAAATKRKLEGLEDGISNSARKRNAVT